MWRNIKIGLQLFAAAVLDLHVKACDFKLPGDICCDFCEEEYYVATNCTKLENGYSGRLCNPCTKCADGVNMIAPCTKFNDTICAVNEPHTTTSPPSFMIMLKPMPIMYMALCSTAALVLIMILTAIMYKWCTRQRSSQDPAETPFKIMV
ncbi:uncharacterized protein Hap1MRO34_025368 isoform 2-T2 [Clarias gariepinus]